MLQARKSSPKTLADGVGAKRHPLQPHASNVDGDVVTSCRQVGDVKTEMDADGLQRASEITFKVVMEHHHEVIPEHVATSREPSRIETATQSSPPGQISTRSGVRPSSMHRSMYELKSRS